jgi:hypothetical protein
MDDDYHFKFPPLPKHPKIITDEKVLDSIYRRRENFRFWLPILGFLC